MQAADKDCGGFFLSFYSHPVNHIDLSVKSVIHCKEKGRKHWVWTFCECDVT